MKINKMEFIPGEKHERANYDYGWIGLPTYNGTTETHGNDLGTGIGTCIHGDNQARSREFTGTVKHADNVKGSLRGYANYPPVIVLSCNRPRHMSSMRVPILIPLYK